MAILFLIVPKTSWDPFGANSTVVSCPYTPGQQCVLPTQGGVGRAALELHPGAGALHKAPATANPRFLQVSKAIRLSSDIYGEHLPAIPPLQTIPTLGSCGEDGAQGRMFIRRIPAVLKSKE